MGLLKNIGFVSLTTVLSIVVLFLLTKLMGAKQVSQMTMFDYVEGITIGSVAAELATDLDAPLNSLTALVIYGLAAVGISLWTSHSLKARRVFTGKPLVLLENGVIYRENLKKAKLDLNEFLTFCRIGGWFDLNQLQTAIQRYRQLSSQGDGPACHPVRFRADAEKNSAADALCHGRQAALRQYPAGGESGELGSPGAAAAGVSGGKGRAAGFVGRRGKADGFPHAACKTGQPDRDAVKRG